MDGNLFAQLFLQIVLIMLNAVFACAEIAVISFNDAKLAKLAQDGNKKAIRLARLTSQPARFLATIQVAITLSGFLGSAFAADNFASLLSEALQGLKLPISPATLNSISVVIITLILSYFTLVFGELVPKRVAMKRAEKLALGMSGLISFISKLFAPLVWLLSVSTNGVLRLIGIDPNEQDDSVTEEEIRMMIDAGSEKGAIDEEEKELLQNVFEFDDLTAGEIATHRTDVTILFLDETVEEWREKIIESRHTFFPVCEETVDNIVGVLNAKDFFAAAGGSMETLLKTAVKKAYLVPESVRADVLFKNLKAQRESFAVVIDEHGGMEGVVTITDILECIVGDFDEDTLAENNGQPDIVQKEENLWRISGQTPIDDVCEALDVEISDEDFDTFGGYVLSILGEIPEDDTVVCVEDENLVIRAVTIKEHRIEMTEVRKKLPPAEEEEEK